MSTGITAHVQSFHGIWTGSCWGRYASVFNVTGADRTNQVFKDTLGMSSLRNPAVSCDTSCVECLSDTLVLILQTSGAVKKSPHAVMMSSPPASLIGCPNSQLHLQPGMLLNS